MAMHFATLAAAFLITSNPAIAKNCPKDDLIDDPFGLHKRVQAEHWAETKIPKVGFLNSKYDRIRNGSISCAQIDWVVLKENAEALRSNQQEISKVFGALVIQKPLKPELRSVIVKRLKPPKKMGRSDRVASKVYERSAYAAIGAAGTATSKALGIVSVPAVLIGISAGLIIPVLMELDRKEIPHGQMSKSELAIAFESAGEIHVYAKVTSSTASTPASVLLTTVFSRKLGDNRQDLFYVLFSKVVHEAVSP